MRQLFLGAAGFLLIALPAFESVAAAPLHQPQASCAVTPYLPESDIPGDAPASLWPTWFGNESLAAGLSPAYRGAWYAGEPGVQVVWWRDVPGELEIEGTRLDESAEPLIVNIPFTPPGYRDQAGYRTTGLLFPAPGCWKVTGRIGDTVLAFVVWVHPVEDHPIHGRADGGCPITPHLPFHPVTSTTNPPAGEFPIWLGVAEVYDFAHMTRSLPPYSGIVWKFLIFVDRSVEGDLRITGHQLDGDGVVLFPEGGQMVTTEDGNTGVVYEDDEPAPEKLIADAHIGSHVRPGQYAEHGSSILFPNPGCYAITATLTAPEHVYTVQVVSEVRGE